MYWGRTNAVQLRLSVDRRCPKYGGRVSKRKEKGKYKERRRTVKAGRSVIRRCLAAVVEEEAMGGSRESMNGGSET